MRPGPRSQRGASSLFLVGLACLTILFHLFLLRSSIEKRLNLCQTGMDPNFEDNLMRQFEAIEQKLDTLQLTDSSPLNVSSSSALISIKSQLRTAIEELRSNTHGVASDSNEFNGIQSHHHHHLSAPLKHAAMSDITLPNNRQKIRLFVGVFTGINDSGRKDAKNGDENARYDYRRRRMAVRETWFPNSREERERIEKESGIVIRFIVGHSSDPKEEEKLAEEERTYGDFLRVPLVESYYALTNKTKTFMATAFSVYDPDWIVKVDDDVYYMFERTLLAMEQWDKMGATYVGCMKHGHVWSTENSRWYEPKHLLLGGDYFLHAYGSIYAVQRKVVENVILRNFNSLRHFANEDVTVGSWMLGQNVVHFEDMRLCATKCSEAAIGVLRNECAGLCNPLKDIYLVHHAKSCQGPPKKPLPYLPSYPEHTEFEKMRV
eukprot:g3840.t1